MKTISFILGVVLITSCGGNNTEEIKIEKNGKIDTLLKQSEINFTNASEASRRSDTVITTKVDNTVKKIVKMEGEIKQLKEENNELKNNLDDANDDGKPFIIRSVSND
jgi:hypothetical protein